MPVLALAVTASPAAAAGALPGCDSLIVYSPSDFSNNSLRINNKYLPLIPGTELTLTGRSNVNGAALPHKVVFTTTDLSKKFSGIRSRVIWDVDISDGVLAESELSFFAQSNDGVVFNTGEYPEEYEDGKLQGAPSTWIAGQDRARAGIHMLARPHGGAGSPVYLQGVAPAIDFKDCGQVIKSDQTVVTPAGTFTGVIVVKEWAPLDPEGGYQLKYHAPGVGIIKIEPLDDPQGETLILTRIRHLEGDAMIHARQEAMKLDKRGYNNAAVYGATEPAIRDSLLPQ
jgi:hypothetical protein